MPTGFIYVFATLAGAFQKHKNSNYQNEICENILNLYSQLFTCIPLSSFYTTELLLPVFDSITQDVSLSPFDTDASNFILTHILFIFQNPRLRVLALTALNELLYKNYVPNDSVSLIVNSFLKVNDTLNCLTNVSNVDEE